MRKLVSSKAAILQANEDIGGDSLDDYNYFMRLVKDAEDKIASFYQYDIKNRVLTINDYYAELPDNTREVVFLLMGDHGEKFDAIYEGISCSNQYDIDYTSVDTGIGLTIVTGGTGESQNIPSYTIQNNKVLFHKGDYDGEKVTVKVLTYRTDNEGMIMVPEEHLTAIACYIEYMTAKRSRRLPGQRLTRGDVADAEKRWLTECANTHALTSMPSDSEEEEVSSMINNPFSGRIWYLNGNAY